VVQLPRFASADLPIPAFILILIRLNLQEEGHAAVLAVVLALPVRAAARRYVKRKQRRPRVSQHLFQRLAGRFLHVIAVQIIPVLFLDRDLDDGLLLFREHVGPENVAVAIHFVGVVGVIVMLAEVDGPFAKRLREALEALLVLEGGLGVGRRQNLDLLIG